MSQRHADEQSSTIGGDSPHDSRFQRQWTTRQWHCLKKSGTAMNLTLQGPFAFNTQAVRNDISSSSPASHSFTIQGEPEGTIRDMEMPGSLAWSTIMKRILNRTLMEGHLSFLQEAAARATTIREAFEKERREHIPGGLSLLAFDACGSVFIVIHECDEAFHRGHSIPDKWKWDTRQLEDTLSEIEVFIKKWTTRGVFKRYYRRRKDQEKAAEFRRCLGKMASRISTVRANTTIQESVEEIIYEKVHQRNTAGISASTMQLIGKFLARLGENEQDKSTLRGDAVDKHGHESFHKKRRGQKYMRGPKVTRQEDGLARRRYQQKGRSRRRTHQSLDNRARPQSASPRITGEDASEKSRSPYSYPNRRYYVPSLGAQAPPSGYPLGTPSGYPVGTPSGYPMGTPYSIPVPTTEPWIEGQYGGHGYYAPYEPPVEAPSQNPIPPMQRRENIESNLRKRPSSRGYTLLPTKASDTSIALAQRSSYAMSEDGYTSEEEDNLTSSDGSWTGDEYDNTDSDGDGSVEELLRNDHISGRSQFRRSLSRRRPRARSTRRPPSRHRRVRVRTPRHKRSSSLFGSFRAAEPGASQTTLGSTRELFSHPSSSFGSLNGSAVSFGSGPTQVTNTNSWNVHHYNIAHSFTAGERSGIKEGANTGRSRTY
ncbi:unnamed protein product [Cyclocybe aegerita]|uniref:Uncharacterized protein n=1 Tax=Cyclocybe aegerita TaxID=1973307 RepID=A0A8S0W4S9_CYCAE|nr:unnamed protein product [Cyclocybe aegerita]